MYANGFSIDPSLSSRAAIKRMKIICIEVGGGVERNVCVCMCERERREREKERGGGGGAEA